ncbi:cache domain-containing protein [Geothrix sp. 21YS21S-2]|uniref:cache domain-containing protein n=1 Tax=Geothrix sp. 21YS21S-2 TaxID=3068893 RepID=UPI0027B89F9D|nr:cache domain-containing protein [Geothrix sp. 21YS21S-2]
MRFAAPLLALTCLVANAQTSERTQAERIVQKAIAYARQDGMDKLILQTNLPHGIFHVGSGSDLYLFVYDLKGVAKANGFQSELVGTSRWDVKDAKGLYQVREFIKVARTKGRGWVDYHFVNPITRKVEPKATYVEAHEGFVFCCGSYRN